ncbi:MAG: ABC transporter ATP-binding protein [Myxococcales bacterium]|nr:MAG: ABC transporter ATP-binding protein [Myxococcales bacterium]
MLAIETERLSRRYGAGTAAKGRLALDQVSLQVEPGEVRGLLGPNGAGKTTLVKILSTVLLPTSGRALVFGHDVEKATREVRSRIGIVFGGDRGLYNNLTARENLEYWAALYDVPIKEVKPRIERLLERVGLAERATQAVSGYSRGMKQRLHLARGLVAGAKVLFLDEPTMGMDPMAARDFRQIVRELRSEGCTILLTTHDMREAEALCDKVALIDRGKVLAVERPAELSRYVARYERIDVEGASDALLESLRSHGGVATVNRAPQGHGHRIELADGDAHRSVLALLVQTGVTSITTSRPSLEEVYVHLIGDRGLEV